MFFVHLTPLPLNWKKTWYKTMLNVSEKSYWFQVNQNTPFYALPPNFCMQSNFLGLIQCIISHKIESINKGALLLKTGKFSSFPSTSKVKHQRGKKFPCWRWQQTYESTWGHLWGPGLEMVANSADFYYLRYRFILKIYNLFHHSCLLFLCALWFRLWTMIWNLISSLNLFMGCLYSLLPMPTLSISFNNSFPALMITLPKVLTQQSSPLQLCWAVLNQPCPASPCSPTSHHIHPHLKTTYNGTRIEWGEKKKKTTKLKCMVFVPEKTELTCDFQLGNRGKNTETQ